MATMKSKIVGVTMGNEQRQENVKDLEKGQQLYELWETDNPFDPNAIKLFADKEHTKPLGYIKKELASDLSKQKEKGWRYTFFCEEVTGYEQKVFGCNIKIEATKIEKS